MRGITPDGTLFHSSFSGSSCFFISKAFSAAPESRQRPRMPILFEAWNEFFRIWRKRRVRLGAESQGRFILSRPAAGGGI
jgi:hypothetical protein